MSLPLVPQLELGAEIFKIIPWPLTEQNNHKWNPGHFFLLCMESNVEEEDLHSCEHHATTPQQ